MKLKMRILQFFGVLLSTPLITLYSCSNIAEYQVPTMFKDKTAIKVLKG